MRNHEPLVLFGLSEKTRGFSFPPDAVESDISESFNPEPTAKAERADAFVSAGTACNGLGALASDPFAVDSGLSDPAWNMCCVIHGLNF